MGSAIVMPTTSHVVYTHTWNNPTFTSDISEGLYQQLPVAVVPLLSLTKAEGIYTKTATVGPYAAGTELRLYTKGDVAQNNLGIGADVAAVPGGYDIIWNYARPFDLTTLVRFAQPAGWALGGVSLP